MSRTILVLAAIGIALGGCGNPHKELGSMVKPDIKVYEPSFEGSKDPGTRGQYVVKVNVPNPSKKDFTLNSVNIAVLSQGAEKCQHKEKVAEVVPALGGSIDVHISVPCKFGDIAPASSVVAKINLTTFKGESVQVVKERGNVQMR